MPLSSGMTKERILAKTMKLTIGDFALKNTLLFTL